MVDIRSALQFLRVGRKHPQELRVGVQSVSHLTRKVSDPR